MVWIAYSVAAIISATLSSADLILATRSAMCLRAVPAATLRILLDVAVAMLGTLGVLSTFADPALLKLIVVGVSAGFAGPGILRAQIVVGGYGSNKTKALGPAETFLRLRERLDRTIDDHNSVAQAAWLTTVAYPSLTDVEELGNYALSYVDSSDRFDRRAREKEKLFVKEVLADESGSVTKVEVLVRRLLDIGGRRLVKRVVSEARRTSKSDSQKV